MRKKIFYIGILLVLILLFIPYRTVSVPEWKIKVLQRNGQSAPQIEVSQEWWDYGILEKKQDVLVSDNEGDLTFPERAFFSPLAVRGLLFFLDSINYFVKPHGAIRGNKSLVRANKTDSVWLWYKQGDNLAEVLQLYY